MLGCDQKDLGLWGQECSINPWMDRDASHCRFGNKCTTSQRDFSLGGQTVSQGDASWKRVISTSLVLAVKKGQY